ncbi:MAG: hypothetical protein U1C48_03190 [Methylotenera sp.]|nr:hypothetical protein [Methylotenera sp.]
MLDVPLFSEAQCNALFAAVLVHDDVNLDAELPEVIHLDYSQEQLTQCYRICRQVWKQGVNRKFLCKLVTRLFWFCTIAQEERRTYHNVRAKIKHLRFAYVTFDERHAYPVHLHRMTRIMGELQDAFKNKQKATIRSLAIKLRFLLMILPYALVTKEIDQFQPSTIESFRKYVNDEINFIRLHLAKKEITSKEFHEMRKVISRQVALYDNLKTLYPSVYHSSMSRYLSTINGLMGSMHDALIAQKFKKTEDYYVATFEMPEEIEQRLIALVDKYKAPY